MKILPAFLAALAAGCTSNLGTDSPSAAPALPAAALRTPGVVVCTSGNAPARAGAAALEAGAVPARDAVTAGERH
jgi:hypothetical protein